MRHGHLGERCHVLPLRWHPCHPHDVSQRVTQGVVAEAGVMVASLTSGSAGQIPIPVHCELCPTPAAAAPAAAPAPPTAAQP